MGTTWILKDEKAIDVFAENLKKYIKEGKRLYFTNHRYGSTEIIAPNEKSKNRNFYRYRGNFGFAPDTPDHKSFMAGKFGTILFVIEESSKVID